MGHTNNNCRKAEPKSDKILNLMKRRMEYEKYDMKTLILQVTYLKIFFALSLTEICEIQNSEICRNKSSKKILKNYYP